MKEILTEEEILSASKVNNNRMHIVGKALMKVMGFKKANELYDQLEGDGISFVNNFFEKLNIDIEFDEKDMKNIPQTGGFITISNHPFGAIDGLLLIKLVGSKRPDIRILANFLLKNIDEISDFFVPVNPFENLKSKSSLAGIKEALTHLSDGGGLGIFPAGEVSSYQTNSRKVTDKAWNLGAIKLIKKAEVPVVPVYFSGGNSVLFHLLGIINPKLRTAQLPKEMLKKRDSVLKVKIGTPISVKQQKEFKSHEQYGRFLRARTFSLESALEVKKFYRRKRKQVSAEPIASEVDSALIEKEIQALDVEQKLVSQQEFDVFLAYSDEIPNTLSEIGRLREITFRNVGEGTNKSTDIDEFDLYYHHLILWDRENKKIAGAYRVGKGDDIISKYGITGFYTTTLFRLSKKMTPILEKTVELGRSFVREEYQLKRLPLFLLWRGIMEFILANRNYRYIIGPVSISNTYSKTSKKIIVQFIKKFYFDHELAKYVKPSNKFKEVIKDEEIKDLIEFSSSDLKQLDQLIADIDPLHFSTPVLLKKYINQNAKIIGFNVDPQFNYALDGLMILDLQDIPEESVKTFTDDISKASH